MLTSVCVKEAPSALGEIKTAPTVLRLVSEPNIWAFAGTWAVEGCEERPPRCGACWLSYMNMHSLARVRREARAPAE